MFSFSEVYGKAIPLTVIDVGAAAIPNESDAYAALSKDPEVSVIGFEPDQAACEARNAEAAPNHKFSPTLWVTAEPAPLRRCGRGIAQARILVPQVHQAVQSAVSAPHVQQHV